ncbi:MAG: 1-acyl-sn-glycerol-3-phosphate acyltransferase [Chthoniobacterales bacterium]
MTTSLYLLAKILSGTLLLLFMAWIVGHLWRQSAYLARGRSRWKRFIQITIHHTLRFFLRLLGGFHYHIKTQGSENLPKHRGGLLICNHVSYLDAILLSIISSRPIRFLSFADFFKQPVLGLILRFFGCIPVSESRANDALRKAAEVIKSGALGCIFPEGKLSTTGELLELKSGYQIIARRAKVPIIPIQIEGLYGSCLSYVDGKCFRFELSHFFKRRPIIISISKPISANEAAPEEVKKILEKLSANAKKQTPPKAPTHSIARRKIIR